MTSIDVDWIALRHEAERIAQNAWAPYSGLSVGAAGLTDGGELVVGCNVENASYGLTLCAECGLISDMHRIGASRLVALAARSGDGALLLPCGRCRQLLFEAGGAALMVDADPEPVRLDVLLARAFGPDDLPERRPPKD